MDPTAIPALAPVDRDEPPLSLSPLGACVAPLVEVAAAVVAEAMLPVAVEPADAVSEAMYDEDDAANEIVSAAVTAYPSTQEIEPPTEDGRLACRSRACSPTKSVDLLVQSQEPSRLRVV